MHELGECVASKRRWNVVARALGDCAQCYHPRRYDPLMTPTVAMPATRIGELERSSGRRLLQLAAQLQRAQPWFDRVPTGPTPSERRATAP